MSAAETSAYLLMAGGLIWVSRSMIPSHHYCLDDDRDKLIAYIGLV